MIYYTIRSTERVSKIIENKILPAPEVVSVVDSVEDSVDDSVDDSVEGSVAVEVDDSVAVGSVGGMQVGHSPSPGGTQSGNRNVLQSSPSEQVRLQMEVRLRIASSSTFVSAVKAEQISSSDSRSNELHPRYTFTYSFPSSSF